MRNLLFLCVLGLAGCISGPVVYDSGAAIATASLSMGDNPGYPFVAGKSGFISVDGFGIRNGPAQSLQLKPGKHSLAYDCPGWFVMDGPPRLAHDFAAGAAYELVCAGKEPHVELVGPGNR